MTSSEVNNQPSKPVPSVEGFFSLVHISAKSRCAGSVEWWGPRLIGRQALIIFFSLPVDTSGILGRWKTKWEYMSNVLIVWGTYREPWRQNNDVSAGRKEVACKSDMIFPAGIHWRCRGWDEGRRYMVVDSDWAWVWGVCEIALLPSSPNPCCISTTPSSSVSSTSHSSLISPSIPPANASYSLFFQSKYMSKRSIDSCLRSQTIICAIKSFLLLAW